MKKWGIFIKKNLKALILFGEGFWEVIKTWGGEPLPRRERPIRQDIRREIVQNFNPRSRTGSDGKVLTVAGRMGQFQSTLPRRERQQNTPIFPLIPPFFTHLTKFFIPPPLFSQSTSFPPLKSQCESSGILGIASISHLIPLSDSETALRSFYLPLSAGNIFLSWQHHYTRSLSLFPFRCCVFPFNFNRSPACQRAVTFAGLLKVLLRGYLTLLFNILSQKSFI